MKLSALILTMMIPCSAFGIARPNDPAIDAPIEMAEPEPQVDKEIFDKMVLELETAPEHAGAFIGFQMGPYFKVVDRRNEVSAKKPLPARTSTERLLSEAIRSASTSVSITFVYERQGIDENGKPFTEKVTINANAATGMAAEAQASMNEAMGKQHM